MNTPSRNTPNELRLENRLQDIIRAADEKQASDIVVLDFREVEGAIIDAFLICSGSSERQIEAITEHIHMTMKKKGVLPRHVEGTILNQWVLMDYGDIIVHIFFEHIREFYRLENLWGQVKRIYPPG